MKNGILVSTLDLRPSLMSVLKGMDEASLLKQVVTTLAIDTDRFAGRNIKAVCRHLPAGWASGIERRFLPLFLNGKVQTIYLREIVRLLTNKIAGRVLAHRVWLWAELGFDREVAQRYSGSYDCIYGMEHSSLETFTRQKKLGGLCVLRQVMAHGRIAANIIERELKKFPGYAVSFGRLFQSDAKRSVFRKQAEYQLADLIAGFRHKQGPSV